MLSADWCSRLESLEWEVGCGYCRRDMLGRLRRGWPCSGCGKTGCEPRSLSKYRHVNVVLNVRRNLKAYQGRAGLFLQQSPF